MYSKWGVTKMPDFAATLTIYLPARDEIQAAEKAWKIAAAINDPRKGTGVLIDEAKVTEVY